MPTHEMWLADPTGRRVRMIGRYSQVDCTKVANDIGVITMEVPSIYDDYIAKDNIIEIWRKPKDGTLSLFNAYFMRSWTYNEIGGVDTTRIVGVDGNYIPSGRIVAYAAGTTSTSMTGAADDLMKAVVSENCATGATDTTRDLSTYFSVAANETAAQSISVGFSYRNVLAVLQDMADASRQAGTRVYFDVMPTYTAGGLIQWHFRTYINQPGIDHTGADQVLFGTKFGNLENPELTFDYSDEISVIYSGGAGIESARIVEPVIDTTRSTETFWARREAFYNCSGQASDTASVYAAGLSEVVNRRPRVRFAALLKDGPSTRFGLDWNFGDKVIATYRGGEYEAIITGVQLSLYGNGDEIIRGRFEVV